MNKQPTISMTHSRLAPTFEVQVNDQFDETRNVKVSGEFALTILVDGKELVTLMTLGMYPEELVLGYLRNQRLIDDINDIKSISVDWEKERAEVMTHNKKGIAGWNQKISKRIVTSGCGQGTVFSCTLDKLYDYRLPDVTIQQSVIYKLLAAIAQHNEIYKAAGAVHGCALCDQDNILMFVEDVGRHNAADAISGMMWLDDLSGENKMLYTTGRLTSEIVMKTAFMGIPILLSRSGVTHMGLELAQDLNVCLIARAKGKAFLCYSNPGHIIYDARPKKPPTREEPAT